MRASTHNAFTAAALAHLRRQVPDRKGDANLVRPSLVDVRASNFINPGEILGFDSAGILPSALEGGREWRTLTRGHFRSAALTGAHKGKFGIATDNAETADENVLAVADGVYPVNLEVPANGAWIPYAEIDTVDKTRLIADPAGSAQILWRQDPADPAVAETVPAYVRLGAPQYRELLCVVTESGGIQPDGSGDVEIYLDPSTPSGYTLTPVFLDWMHSDLQVSQGKKALAGYFWPEDRWRLVAAECEDEDTAPPMTFRGEWDPNY